MEYKRKGSTHVPSELDFYSCRYRYDLIDKLGKDGYILIMKFSVNFLNQVKQLFDQLIGSREIARQLNCSRWKVQQAYKTLGIYDSGRSMPRKAYLATEKCCKICKNIKSIAEFRQRIKGDRISYESNCLNCETILNKIRLNKRAKRLRQNDPSFKIRSSLSYAIWYSLKYNNTSKNGKSCLDYLPYTLDQLKEHLEAQFEPWMTWENHGTYNKKNWNDNDPNTWKWQIDHIIPHSTFTYSSMDCQEFNTCWALTNLRPYSAKQNIIDGTNRIRHITNINI